MLQHPYILIYERRSKQKNSLLKNWSSQLHFLSWKWQLRFVLHFCVFFTTWATFSVTSHIHLGLNKEMCLLKSIFLSSQLDMYLVSLSNLTLHKGKWARLKYPRYKQKKVPRISFFVSLSRNFDNWYYHCWLLHPAGHGQHGVHQHHCCCYSLIENGACGCCAYVV